MTELQAKFRYRTGRFWILPENQGPAADVVPRMSLQTARIFQERAETF